MIRNWSLIVAVSDDAVLKNTLLRSPDIGERCQMIMKYGFSSAGRAYNAGIAEASGDVLIFAHQDVYLPKGWFQSLDAALRSLSEQDPNWGMLGVSGITKDGGVASTAYATGPKLMCGVPVHRPTETRSLDELLLVLRSGAHLRFDEDLPGFHFYGTDICLQARERGMKSYIIPAFCIHNSTGKRYLPLAFWRSYLYMRKKWWRDLPITTCCTTITKTCWRSVVGSLRTTCSRLLHPSYVGGRTDDVEMLYAKLRVAFPERVAGTEA